MSRHKVTQAELAAAIGVSQSQLSKMVRGTRPIDIDELDGMATALGTDAWSLLREAEDVLADFTVGGLNTSSVFVQDGRRLETPIATGSDVGGPIDAEALGEMEEGQLRSRYDLAANTDRSADTLDDDAL